MGRNVVWSRATPPLRAPCRLRWLKQLPSLFSAILLAFALEASASQSVTVNVYGGYEAGTNRPVAVRFSIGGKAKLRKDYTLGVAGTTVVIPPGSDSVSIPVKTRKDKIREKPESVTLTVVPGSGYSVGAKSRATLTIVSPK
jgi:hypothetical protein